MNIGVFSGNKWLRFNLKIKRPMKFILQVWHFRLKLCFLNCSYKFIAGFNHNRRASFVRRQFKNNFHLCFSSHPRTNLWLNYLKLKTTYRTIFLFLYILYTNNEYIYTRVQVREILHEPRGWSALTTTFCEDPNAIDFTHEKQFCL